MHENCFARYFFSMGFARFSLGCLIDAFRIRPLKSDATKKMKNRILAIPAEAAAIPPKPNKAATSATTRKMSVHRNMGKLHIPMNVCNRHTSPGCVHAGSSPSI